MSTPRTMPRKISALITLFVAPALALTGCSGSSNRTTSLNTSTATPSVGTGANMSGCIKSGEFDKEQEYIGETVNYFGGRKFQVRYHKGYQVLTLGE